jgi:hypothetical protein
MVPIAFTVILGTAFVWYCLATVRFARSRSAVIKQTGERWYRYACREIFSQRGQEFLKEHFAETFESERVCAERERPFAQTAALGVYLRILEESGKDSTKYDTLPVDDDAIAQARVRSRVAVPSFLNKDVIVLPQ